MKKREYEVVITHKARKGIRLWITGDGEVKLSASFYTKISDIEAFIDKNDQWIKNHLYPIQSKKKLLSVDYENSDKILLLGDIYDIEIVFSADNKIFVDKGSKKIYLYVLPENTPEQREKIIKTELMGMLEKILMEFTEKYSKLTGYTPESMKIRSMTSCWGSCNFKKKSITYNYKLIEKPLDSIEYVVLHEISHIPYPNHQKGFWDFVGSFMPDWKNRKKLLKDC